MDHLYISTYCQHGLHSDCRLACKICAAPCLCPCHGAMAGGKLVEAEVPVATA